MKARTIGASFDSFIGMVWYLQIAPFSASRGLWVETLIYSHFFTPSVGGVETITLSLARGLAELRDSSGAPQFETTLVTQTPSANYDDRANAFAPFARRVSFNSGSSFAQVTSARRRSRSRTPVPGLLARKPVVVEHHGFQTIVPTVNF